MNRFLSQKHDFFTMKNFDEGKNFFTLNKEFAPDKQIFHPVNILSALSFEIAFVFFFIKVSP